MYESEVSVAEIEAVLERSRRRKDELDSEYEQQTAAVQAEVDERERVFQEEEERARREEEQRREAERAVLRERARREQIRIGEQDDEDPFVDQVSSGGFPAGPAAGSADVGGAQPPLTRPDPGWNVAAGRFGSSAPEEAPSEQQPPDPRPGPPPREQPAPAPPPRRRAAAADDWDDEEDFSQRSWLR
ncbi:hypothetical protein CDG81_19750 [Actinopolyspora erythraea]|uniref:Translation initiation factor IF-2 n=1 Tax=Actinopolyspora erythraea TaxID=414996 RepID=A0A099DAY8_9ACTN|nr:hypothetical protein [Actinopolyspora erythraea]ASU80124.1 hypothetical protein CDG81_19750 [Actinopolyspora erythraea]KGI82505.1 hypothetical protein IL38_05140 [Actinopolyspora erythraea]